MAVDRHQLQLLGLDAYLLPDVALSPLFKVWIELERMPLPRTARDWKRFRRYSDVLAATPAVKPADLVALLIPIIDVTDLGNVFVHGGPLAVDGAPTQPAATQREVACDGNAHGPPDRSSLVPARRTAA